MLPKKKKASQFGQKIMMISMNGKENFLTFQKRKTLKFLNDLALQVSCKKKEAAKINIQKEKESTKSNENVVLEEIVIDDIEIDGKTSFTTTIPVLQVFDSDDSADETPSPRCLLQYGDLKLISNKRMLNDNVINAVQKMLHTQYPDIDGLQDTILGQTLNYEIYRSKPFVQILHDGNIHWLAISTINCSPGKVMVMDSMFKGRMNHHVQRQICAIMHCLLDKITPTALPVQQQTNGVDCVVNALAFVQYLMENKKYPTDVSFDQTQMRNHLLKALKENKLSTFPSGVNRVKKNKRKEIPLMIHCICRMIWAEYRNLLSADMDVS